MSRAGGKPCFFEIYGPGDSTLAGEPNPAPVLLKTVWGSLIPVRGREFEGVADRQAENIYKARLDYLDGRDIAQTMFIVAEGQTFGIDGVMIDHVTKRTVDLILSERKAGA